MIATSSEEQLESMAETVIQDVEMINGDKSKVLAGQGGFFYEDSKRNGIFHPGTGQSSA